MKQHEITICEDQEIEIVNWTPIGTIIDLNADNGESRIAKAAFEKWLFEYFHNLSTGQTGWGISFRDWLRMIKGWEHIELRKFKRVLSVEEEDGVTF